MWGWAWGDSRPGRPPQARATNRPTATVAAAWLPTGGGTYDQARHLPVGLDDESMAQLREWAAE